ncbi:hypothetical protein M3J09_013392 [Ascochyta lentis]
MRYHRLGDVSLGLVDSAHKVDLLNQDLFLARLVARLDLQGIYEVFAEIMSLEWYAAAIIEFRYP